MTTPEQIARAIPDDVSPSDLATAQGCVTWWLDRAVEAEARAAEWQGVLRMYERQVMPNDRPQHTSAVTGDSPSGERASAVIAHFAYWRWLDADVHAKTFRSMAAKAEGIYDRLVAQKALYDANQAKDVAELSRMFTRKEEDT